MKRYYVYILRCADGALYVGITSDLDKRFGQHQDGWNPKCYTHERRPVTLVYSSEFHNVDDAINWEKRLKGWSRAKKLALIKDDWSRIHTLAQRHTRLKKAPRQTTS